MSKELYDKIKQYSDAVKARFCMPGHGGHSALDGIYSASGFDWTEVQGLDNLLYSDGVIAGCERQIASNYGYQNALMLTSGSTCGMQIALALTKSREGVALAIGDMHKSFYCASRLFGVDAVCCKDLKEAEKALAERKIACVFVTSPNYFGKVYPLKEVKDFAVRAGALLVVDEAHSAHFPFSPLLPQNASKYADISLVSMHKTLPVYGGGAILFTNSKELYQECRLLRAEIHSTSPNYLVMASMDYANDYMANHGQEEYAKVKLAVDEFKSKLKVGKVVDNDDFSRVVVKIDGVDCDKVSDELTKRGVFAEMSYGDTLVFIVTPFNCDKLKLLADELNSVSLEKLDGDVDVELNLQNVKKQGSVVLVSPDEAEGKVCAVDVGIYPPGVPVIKKGDVINKNAIEFIKKYSSRLFGLASNMLPVIK